MGLNYFNSVILNNGLDYLKQVLLSDAFEAFLCSGIFDKAVFCLGEKQGTLVNDKCSFWSIWDNRVGDFCCWFGTRERKFYMVDGSVRPTPLQSVRPVALSVMAVE